MIWLMFNFGSGGVKDYFLGSKAVLAIFLLFNGRKIELFFWKFSGSFNYK